MTKPLALGTLLGGLALFLWGAIYHMALPFYNAAMLPFANEDTVAQAVVAGAPQPGTYVLPNLPAGATDEQRKQGMSAIEEKAQRGPMVLAFVRPGPLGSFGTLLGVQLVLDLSLGLMATLILLNARPQSFGGRVLLLAGVGLAIWLSTSAPEWNWYSSGAAWALANLGEQVGGWALAGLVLAKVVPRT
jgi:hypothetical protein